MSRRTRYSIAGALGAIGLLAGALGGVAMMYPPSLQRMLHGLVADVVVVLLALGTVSSLVQWAREPGFLERRAFVAALLTAGAAAVLANLLGPAVGWWVGPVFDAPLLPLALLTGLKAIVYFGLLLLLYRWLAARRPWLARLTYFVVMLLLIPAAVLADEMVLRSGKLAFGGGYAIWHDVLFGEALFALPPICYELYRHPWP